MQAKTRSKPTRGTSAEQDIYGMQCCHRSRQQNTQSKEKLGKGAKGQGGKKVMKSAKPSKEKTAAATGGFVSRRRDAANKLNIAGITSVDSSTLPQDTQKSTQRQMPESSYADPTDGATPMDNTFIKLDDTNEIYDKSFQQSTDRPPEGSLMKKESHKSLQQAQQMIQEEPTDDRAGFESSQGRPNEYHDGQGKKMAGPHTAQTTDQSHRSHSQVADCEAVLLNTIGKVFTNRKQPANEEEPTQRQSIVPMKSSSRKEAQKVVQNKSTAQGMGKYHDILESKFNKTSKKKSKISNRRESMPVAHTKAKPSSTLNDVMYLQDDNEPIPVISAAQQPQQVAPVFERYKPNRHAQGHGGQSSNSKESSLMARRKKFSQSQIEPVRDEVPRMSTGLTSPFQNNQLANNQVMVLVKEPEQLEQQVYNQIKADQNQQAQNVQQPEVSPEYHEQYFKHLNRKNRGSIVSNNSRKKDVESVYFAKIQTLSIGDDTPQKPSFATPDDPRERGDLNISDYASPTFTPLRQEKNADLQVPSGGSVSRIPPIDHTQSLIQSQFLDNSQRLTQMESIKHIHSNQHNDPQTLNRIAETNLTKHVINQKIRELRQERNSSVVPKNSRSFTPNDQHSTLSAGYGTLGTVDQLANLDQNPRDSSRIPRQQELVDLKNLMPTSPKEYDNNQKRVAAQQFLKTRNDTQIRTASHSQFRSNKILETIGSLNQQMRSSSSQNRRFATSTKAALPGAAALTSGRNASNGFEASFASHRMTAKNSNNQTTSFQEILKEYQIEGDTYTQWEKKLMVLELHRAKAKQMVEQTRIDSEIQYLMAAKNRLDKEDRKNHAKLVKDSIENRSRLMANEQKKISVQQKEKVLKKSFDVAMEQRHNFKQDQHVRKEKILNKKEMQLSKNKEMVQKIKIEKLNKQIENEKIKAEKLQLAKEQRDLQLLRRLMKEDLKSTLDEEIRIHQEQLKELKELRDNHINDMSSLHSSTWMGASTSTLVKKLKQQSLTGTTALILSNQQKLNMQQQPELQQVDITKKQYIAPVKEINLYERRMVANRQQVSQQQQQVEQQQQQAKQQLVAQTFSRRKMSQPVTKLVLNNDQFASEVPRSDSRGTLQIVKSPTMLSTKPEMEKKSHNFEPNENESPAVVIEPSSRNMGINSHQRCISALQNSLERSKELTKNTKQPAGQQRITKQTPLNKSATAKILRQNGKGNLNSSPNRLAKLRNKYDKSQKNLHDRKNSSKKDQLTGNLSNSNNLSQIIEVDKQKAPTIPPLKLAPETSEFGDGKAPALDLDSELAQQKYQQSILQEGISHPEYSSQGQSAVNRISKKERMELRNQSVSSNKEYKRRVINFNQPPSVMEESVNPQALQRCLSSQGSINGLAQQQLMSETVRNDNQKKEIQIEHLDQYRLMTSPDRIQPTKMPGKKTQQNTPQQSHSVKILQFTNQQSQEMEATTKTNQLLNVHQITTQQISQGFQIYTKVGGNQEELATGSIYNASSPSQRRRGVSQGEATDPQFGGETGYHLPEQDEVSEGFPVSSHLSFTSSSRHFRSSRAIIALKQRQDRVTHKTKMVKQQQLLKQQSEEALLKEQEAKIPKPETLIDKQLQLRQIETKLTEQDKTDIQSKAKALIRETKLAERARMKGTPLLGTTIKPEYQNPVNPKKKSNRQSPDYKAMLPNKQANRHSHCHNRRGSQQV